MTVVSEEMREAAHTILWDKYQVTVSPKAVEEAVAAALACVKQDKSLKARAAQVAVELCLPRRLKQVLYKLADSKEPVLTHRLLFAMYGDDPEGGPVSAEQSLHVYISRLRRRLAPHGFKITCQRHIGYSLHYTSTD